MCKFFSVSVQKFTHICQKQKTGDYMSRKHIEIDPECGRRLKGLLVKNKVPQCDLATKLGHEPQHISNIVRGKRRLTPDLAQRIVDEVFPSINVEWLLNRSDYETIEEKERYSQKVWEENHKAALLYDKVFRCFIDGIEDLCGYGLHSQGTDPLIGDYIAITDSAGEKVGAISVETFHNLQSELENYASYLIQRIIKTEMIPLPGEEEEGVDKWLTSKSAVTNPAG